MRSLYLSTLPLLQTTFWVVLFLSHQELSAAEINTLKLQCELRLSEKAAWLLPLWFSVE